MSLLRDLENAGFSVEAEEKLWPDRMLFDNPCVGDYVLVCTSAEQA